MIPIRRRLYQSQPGFTPRQLFAALQGAWLEPTPGFIWQENAGATPTTTGGQTIGLILDQSQGEDLGFELVTNGVFETNTTGWISVFSAALESVSGELRITSTTGSGGSGATQTISGLTIGKTYRVTATMRCGTTTNIGIWVNPGATLGTGYLILGNTASTSNITVSGVFLATNTQVTIYARAAAISVGSTGFFDNISVKEILSGIAYQSTAANRPTYQLNSNGMPLARHDTTDSLVVSLPNLGGGIYSASGSVYFATPQGMSALHGQSMGTTYTLPAPSTDIYSWIVVPQRLNTALEARLERYMLRKAGLALLDYLTDDMGEILADDIGDPLLAG